MPEKTTHTATGYLILEASRYTYGLPGKDGLKQIKAVRIAGYRAGRPGTLARDQIAVKVGVTVDESEFSPITAELALTLDPSRVVHPVVEDLEPTE
ncbi:Uncharacterised protein [Mycobacteroides abscessus subsp. bolletii]|uniref:Uncharacterized protein n=1 Tax=Mycobacteroides abscessus subsp. bolletii TaxID=319705 RepID=A0A9Q7SE51_9MYCO|nr:hypothetical protein [Mycobacteroides abscessus]SHT84990.1 Uncharacterised protein [Mycobacteroides abscessus subsp. bolletii]SHU02663.1 Uncharacterised protein [Mycobacteroides abscessus subsp. bolletii]SHX42671.1 Uncharacterised protein [Mycobacteroides abscessus subsp. bolletii]SKM65325.1 Uncharacterised protein [Mycobacteroides abscessus subsp. bolletii]SKN39214.1 Uncharacterised protein [Mycobacteroides abscessus subsp. bolletii]